MLPADPPAAARPAHPVMADAPFATVVAPKLMAPLPCAGAVEEGVGARLMVAVAVAPRAQHLRFERRDAGHTDEEPVDQDRCQQRRKAPRISQRVVNRDRDDR